MSEEIKALESNGTWQLVKCPVDHPVVDCRWVYKVKVNHDGSEKLKARLVARGFSQRYGENYWETYAPVVKSSTVRLLMALAVECDLKIGQIDVRNAYVKSELNEEVYMNQPPGFERGDGLVLKLKKSLYGLKQAGHEWGQCLSDFLVKEMKFERLKSDPCVYLKGKGADRVIIAVYVDDLLIFSGAEERISSFKRRFDEKFEIEDLGECKKIIGIEVNRRADGSVAIHQRQFIKELLGRYGMSECNAARTPMTPSLELCCKEETCDDCELVDGTLYRGLIGRLLYLAGSTRPDISYAVSNLSRFNNKPHPTHLKAAKHVLRYLKGTTEVEIMYRKTGQLLFGHSDADYGNCKLDRKSYTGFIVLLAGGPISWEARKQVTVALSSTEAEYMAITSAAKEIMFCRQIMREIGAERFIKGASELFSDNTSAICLARNVGFSARTKHIDIRHHYIRELVDQNLITLQHIGTQDMLADFLTKALGPIKHSINISRIFSRD